MDRFGIRARMAEHGDSSDPWAISVLPCDERGRSGHRDYCKTHVIVSRGHGEEKQRFGIMIAEDVSEAEVLASIQ